MVFSKKLKIILLFSVIFVSAVFIRIITVNKSKYEESETNLTGTIIDIKKYDNYVSYIVQAKEKVLVRCFECDVKAKLGDVIKASGTFKEPSANTVFHLFNYKNYLKSKKINWMFDVSDYLITSKKNVLYEFKSKIIERINDIDNEYLNLFIIGVNSLEESVYENYQNIGISHLFAVSGMHISILTSFFIAVLKRLIKNKVIVTIITICFVLFFMFLTNFSPSVIRSGMLFIGLRLCDFFKINLKPLSLLLIIAGLMLIYNPYYVYSISFVFSFVITFYLMLFGKKDMHKHNYFYKTFMTSLLAFLVSLPIVINNFFSVNLLTPLFNVIAVPLVSFFIFPLSLLTFVFPFLNGGLVFLLDKFELLISFFNKSSIILFFGYMHPILVIVYYFILTSLYYKFKKIKVLVLIVYIFVLYNISYLKFDYRVTFIDVGQGDATLVELPFNRGNVLIDTGGSINYDISKKTLVPFLKSRGIKKLDYLILTHGDLDHMGASSSLVKSFEVDNVIFNNGKFNDLEEELIELLERKHVSYYKGMKYLDLANDKFYFLNTEIYDDENDNSNVIYTEFNNIKLLLMGDAGVDVEKKVLSKVNLNDVDVLKVGHHGSKNSTSKTFVDIINPRYSIISVGKNNRYGHPNNSVLSNLANSQIYRTDMDGSIMFKIKKSKIEIKTCVA